MNARRTHLRRIAAALVAAAAFFSCVSGLAAQPAKGKPAAPEVDDLRAVRATPADVMDGRKLSEGSCVRCHGADGVSATKGVPNLAGQRAAYLFSKLRTYQTGTRTDHAMESSVKFLNEDALVKVSAYYASLEPSAPSAEALKRPQNDRDPLAGAKAAAAGCVGCHGDNGVSKIPGTPSLAGLDPKYFVAAMSAYKSGSRRHDMMKALATPLSDADVKSIAVMFGLQKPAKVATPAAGDAAAGKTASAACSGCHGETGVSTNPANPSLAGQDPQYVVATLKAYKDGSRKEETMKLATGAMAEKAMADVAAFYAQQEPRAPKVEKPLTLAEWAQRCDRCHGVNGNSNDPRVPMIAAQRIDYLQKALRAYQAGQRKNSVMAAMSGTLGESDVENLAVYYARQKARAVVFVTLPAR